MAEAKARFRIEGEDRTAAAFNSATKNATRSAGAMRGAFNNAFKGIGGALAAAFSVRAITQAATQTLNFADQLNKAATQAGLTTEAMSELAYAANLSGVNTQQLSAALRFMQKGLSEASQGVGEARQAIKALGLDLDAVRKLKPDEQFELIAEQLSKLPDPADRARAAMKLFGDSGAQLLPLMEQGAEGVRKLRDEAERLGQSFSKEQLDRLTAAKDAIDRMKASFSALAVTLMAEVAPALKGFFDDITAFITSDKLAKLEEQLRFLDRMAAGGMGGFNIAISGDDMIGTGIFGPEEIERIRQRISAERARLLNQDRPTYRRGRGSNREQADEPPPGFVDAMRGLEEVTITSSRIMTTAMQQFYDSLETDTRTSTEKAVAEFEAFKAKLDELFSEGLIDTSVYNERMQEFLDKNLEEVQVSSQKIFKELEAQATAFEAFAEQAAANMQTALADFLFDPFQNGLKGMLKGFIDTIRRMVAEVAAQQILTALFGQFTSSGGFLGAFAKKITGNAMGGSVSAGTPYIVGERGPELFVPGYTGSIVPNHKMGGGVTVAPTYNIDARGATTDLVQQLPAILSAHARQTVELARRAINDDISRGALGRA